MADYFKEKARQNPAYDLQHAGDWLCVEHKGKMGKAYTPLELVTLAGGKAQSNLDQEEREAILRASCTPVNDR